MKILGIIPARYASTRFPAKPLAEIAGQTMIERVYRQVEKSNVNETIVATDDERILRHVLAFGGKACMTSPDHQSGTDRCYEALQQQTQHYDYVINVQGDEPFIDPHQINLIASLLDGMAELATLGKKINSSEQLFNPNVVKLVKDSSGRALYFSRSTIPHLRSTPENEWLAKHSFFKHIGMYAYRTDILKKITQLPVSSLERAEALEQLRWLENGFSIQVAETDVETIGVDTPEDLKKAIAFIEASR